jgi:hypothetical protein
MSISATAVKAEKSGMSQYGFVQSRSVGVRVLTGVIREKIQITRPQCHAHKMTVYAIGDVSNDVVERGIRRAHPGQDLAAHAS